MGEDLGAPLGAKKTSDAKYSKPGEEVRLGKRKERQVTVYLPSSWSEELLSKKKKKGLVETHSNCHGMPPGEAGACSISLAQGTLTGMLGRGTSSPSLGFTQMEWSSQLRGSRREEARKTRHLLSLQNLSVCFSIALNYLLIHDRSRFPI